MQGGLLVVQGLTCRAHVSAGMIHAMKPGHRIMCSATQNTERSMASLPPALRVSVEHILPVSSLPVHAGRSCLAPDQAEIVQAVCG